MTYTYDPKQLATSQMMQVRLLIGDTDSSDPIMQDEEIVYSLTQRTTSYGAAADCARTIASRFSRQVDSGIDGMRASNSQKSENFRILAAQLDAKATEIGAAMPYAGGISKADKASQEGDTDRVKPQFNLGMTDSELPVPSVGNETPNT